MINYELIGKKVVINGVNGTVTGDNQDGTFTVSLENHTIYFAIEDEINLKPQMNNTPKYITCILDKSEANFIEKQLIGAMYRKEKHRFAYRNAVRLLKRFGINAHKKDKWDVLNLLTDLIRESVYHEIRNAN